jgi:TonB family protein
MIKAMHKHVVLLLLSCCCFVPGVMAQNQQSVTESSRKLLRKVDPVYPEMARKMNLAGTVRVFAIVGPDGNVKSVEPVGGSPVLVQAAQEAVTRWKFAPASSESKELVELHFHPQ